ncbi:MAG: cobalamin biosynthesis protein [Eubacteriaceae bacterium]|nr:cobalamin biosynthesis protein [Eubacteriaceae bacterium]
MSFTSKGKALADTIGNLAVEGGIASSFSSARVKNLAEHVAGIFEPGNTLIFVGAAGIATRAIAPYIKHKSVDPAVIVVDEGGSFAIPILSGHIGGANRIAREIASISGAVAVITTATDVNGVFSIDEYASQNRYAIINPEAIKRVASSLLGGSQVGFYSDYPVDTLLPAGILHSTTGDVGICISQDTDKKPFRATLNLAPKNIHVGIGSRRGVATDTTELFFLECLENLCISVEAVGSISSIDLKKDEEAICAISKKYTIPFITYSAQRLESVAQMFGQSEFVRAQTGTGSVCEAAAYLSSKRGRILQAKTAKDKVTVAVAEELWRVSFETVDDRT